MKFSSRVLAIGLASAVTVISGVVAVSAAQASGQTVADDQSSLVEDYAYPGADKIFTDYKVKLISGDGHILFVPCPTTGSPDGLILVNTTDGSIGSGNPGDICFRITAPTGHLSLKIPAVYGIRGDGVTQGTGHKVKAELTTDAGKHTIVDVNPIGSTPVGIVANPPTAPTTLLQLDASS